MYFTRDEGGRPKFSRDGKSLWYVSGGRPSGAARGQLDIAPVTMNHLTIVAPSVVLVENPANGLSFPAIRRGGGWTAADDPPTRRADPLPGDEARLVLVQNWVAATKK